MADKKDYITQVQENGNVHISEDVIASISAVAVKEVEGVCGMLGGFGSDISEMLGVKNNSKGLKIAFKESNIEIECNIIAKYGHSVVDIAKNVQSGVITAVESMTGMKVDAVNVNVCGISMEK